MIIDAVYYNNMKALRCITHSGDEQTGQKEGLDETIWVMMKRVPEQASRNNEKAWWVHLFSLMNTVLLSVRGQGFAPHVLVFRNHQFPIGAGPVSEKKRPGP